MKKLLSVLSLLAVMVLPALAMAAHLGCDPYPYSGTTEIPVTFNVFIDGATTPISTPATPYPGTTTGQVYLYYDISSLAAGKHTAYAQACDPTCVPTCSLSSTTITFTVGAPAAPTNLKVLP